VEHLVIRTKTEDVRATGAPSDSREGGISNHTIAEIDFAIVSRIAHPFSVLTTICNTVTHPQEMLGVMLPHLMLMLFIGVRKIGG